MAADIIAIVVIARTRSKLEMLPGLLLSKRSRRNSAGVCLWVAGVAVGLYALDLWSNDDWEILWDPFRKKLSEEERKNRCATILWLADCCGFFVFSQLGYRSQLSHASASSPYGTEIVCTIPCLRSILISCFVVRIVLASASLAILL